MRFRYKKLIIVFTLFIMILGMATFSMLKPNIHFSFGNKSSYTDVSNITTFGAISASNGESASKITGKINTLVNKYYDAKQKVNMSAVGECVSDVSMVQEKKLLTEAAYVEKYTDIKCNILQAAEEGAYRVYVYYNVKIYDIDTLVPSLTAIYIKTNEDGDLKIYLGTLSDKEQENIIALDGLDIVKKLTADVQNNLQMVIKKDSDVRKFYQMLQDKTSTDSSKEDNANIDKEAKTTD